MNFDVIVIGTGFGGAITGCRLAEHGYKVLMLERGKRWDENNYPRTASDEWLFDHQRPDAGNGWLDFRQFSTMSVMSGVGVGGGSLINANVFMTPPEHIFQSGWPRNITYGELAPYYGTAGEFINAQHVPRDAMITSREEYLRHAAHALGYTNRFRRLELTVSFNEEFWGPCWPENSISFVNRQGVNQGTCVFLGDCPIGCPVKAKNTLSLNYLPWAERHGAEIREYHSASVIEQVAGGFRVSYEVTGPDRRDRRTASESARIVVIAAGSLGSTELLLKCRDVFKTLPGISQLLGRNWSANGFLFVPAFLDHIPVNSSVGPTTSSALDFLDGSEGGQSFMLGDGGLPNTLGEFLVVWATKQPRTAWEAAALNTVNKCLMNPHIQNTMPFLAQGIDAGNGKMSLANGELDLGWDLQSSYPLIGAIVNTIERILTATGGSAIVPFAQSPPSHLITAHPLGGCNMGNSSNDGVVDHRGEVFGYSNLYVADSSIVPRPLGVPPSRTVAALAERIAARIIADDGASGKEAHGVPTVSVPTVIVKDMASAHGKIAIEDVGNVAGVRAGRIEGNKIAIGGSIEASEINSGLSVQVGDGNQQTNIFGVPAARYLQGRLGNHARLGERIPLQVRVALQTGNDASIALKPMALPPEGGDVKLVLYCPGFEAKSAMIQVIHVPARDDSGWTLFELEARQQGVFTIEVSAYRDATFLGVLQMQVTVDNQQIAGNNIDCTAPLSDRLPQPGEVTLLIHYDDKDRVYRYQLIDHTIGGPDEMRSSVLQRTPQDAIEDLIKRLNAQARDLTGFTAKATREWLIGKGIDLWNEFIPLELQDLLWERRDRMKHLTILSSGDPVPWEVLYPFKPGQEDGGFLGEQLSISRWRYGPAAPDRLRLPSPYFVLPAGSPPTATSEITALRALIGNASTVNELEELLNVFTNARFGLLHFACHNTFSPSSPTSSYVTMGQQSFEPTFLSRYAEKFRPQALLVFMNACRTDAVAPNYTRLTGWADRFLSAGAGAFIGTLWEVRDTSASDFAGEFYSTLLKGATLADAMKAGRATIQDRPGDPTWLAYTLYGDPAATFAKEA